MTNGKVLKELEFTTKQYSESGATPDLVDVKQLSEGLRLISEKKTPANLDLVTKILEMPAVPYERQLRPHHVANLKKAQERGTFRWELVRVMFCKAKWLKPEITYRINGQHFGWSVYDLITSGVKIGDNHVTVATYEADSEQDMRQLYASVDRGAPRSKGGVVNAYLLGAEGFEDFRVETIRNLAVGFAAWKWDQNERSRHDADEIAILLQTEVYDIAVKIGNFLQSGSCASTAHLRRGPVLAAMFETWQRHQADSVVFWTATRDGEGMKSDDPAMKLRTELLRTSVNTGNGSRSAFKLASQTDMYAWCINAWNKFRKGEPLQKLHGETKGQKPRAR